MRSPKVTSARLPTPNGVKSDAIVKVSGLIGRKRNLIMAPKRKRKCILRPAPFSRLRSWPHRRRRRSLNLEERPIRTGPASRSRRRLFRSPRSGPALRSISTPRAGGVKATSPTWRRRWRSAAFPSLTLRPQLRASRRRPGPTRTPSFCAPSPRPLRTCRSSARKSLTAWIELAAGRRPWPIASAQRTRPCKNLRTRRVTARRRPAATVKSGCYGTSASSTFAVRPSLTFARRRH